MLDRVTRHASLATGRAAVWWLPLDTAGEAEWRRWSALLDPEETARAARFRFATDREQYIAAHALARVMLGSFGDRPATEWRFLAGPHGKPAPIPPDGDPPLTFNISHTKGLVACVVARGLDAGVNVEALDRPRLDLAVADRFFAPEEVALVRDAPAGTARDTFFRIWTLKESFIKATGDGLSLGLASFAFALDPIRLQFSPGPPAPWYFDQDRPTPRHMLALGLRGSAAPVVEIRGIRPGDL